MRRAGVEHILSALPGSSDQLDEKIDTLKRKLQLLESIEDDVKEELKQLEGSFPTKKPRKEVQTWSAEVPRMKAKVQHVVKEAQERRSWHRNPQLQKKLDNLTTELAELIEQSKFPRGLTLESCERGGIALLTKRLIGETFQKNKNMIRDCLMGEEASVIGIYGMAGVGKTTLLKHIHNELLTRQVNVSWVTVSQNCSIHKLQHDIAKTLQLDISKEDDKGKRAAALASAFAFTLKRRNNFILILDDVWDPISLEEVGNPVDLDGCKLVLTTRSLEVCRRMSCGEQIKVMPLSENEAWVLFRETLGNQTSVSPEIEEIAKPLVKECGGLPLAIITMAGSMKGVDDIHEWRHAFEKIREGKHGEMDLVFRVLEYSYRKLNPKMQECFLYCSLYPEDSGIRRDELIEHFIDEKLIDGVRSRESQFDEGHVILNKLENICLLEGEITWLGYKDVKMHDLVRDMAIKVASVSPYRFLVKAGIRLRDIPNEEEWSEDLVRISLRQNDIQSIPFYSSPKCPKLLTLMLCGNYTLKVIPRLFFMHMKLLTILDLSNTHIKCLPSSISHLESLTALLLRGCRSLESVPSLKNLVALRRLDLGYTAIKEVPEDLEKLINLRYLYFLGCEHLKTIPNGILSKLSRMEYFRSAEGVTLSGEEIGSWKRLETFDGRFDQVCELSSCVGLWEGKEPKAYRFNVGYDSNDDDVCHYYPILDRQVRLRKVVVGLEDRFALPRGIQLLEFDDCDGITILSHVLSLEETPDLTRCEVCNCGTIRHVICSCCRNVLFSQKLESLFLRHLPMLTDLVERERRLPSSSSSSSSVLPTTTFSSLVSLDIRGCDALKRLFTPTLLSHLQSLELCQVLGCRQLMEIIGEGSDEGNNKETTTAVISMPTRLQSLGLWDLPELKSLCNSSIKLADSLKEIRLIGCRRLERITLLWEEPRRPPRSLTGLFVEKDWWDSVEWKHPSTKDILRPYVSYLSA